MELLEEFRTAGSEQCIIIGLAYVAIALYKKDLIVPKLLVLLVQIIML